MLGRIEVPPKLIIWILIVDITCQCELNLSPGDRWAGVAGGHSLCEFILRRVSQPAGFPADV